VQLRVLERLARVRANRGQPGFRRDRAALADLKALEEDGLILLGERQTWRDLLAERDFVPAVAPKLTPEQHEVWDVIEGAIKGGCGKSNKSLPPSHTERGKEESGAWRRKDGTPTYLWEKLKPLAREKVISQLAPKICSGNIYAATR
jgi:hypothetical protein